MKSHAYTVMLVGDAQDGVRNLRVHRRGVLLALSAAAVVMLGTVAVVGHYFVLVQDTFALAAVRQENAALRERLHEVNEIVASLESTVTDVREHDQKLRAMTDLRAEGHGLAIGPVRPSQGVPGAIARDVDPFGVPLRGEDRAARSFEDALLDGRAHALRHEGESRRTSLEELLSYFSQREELLSRTPSVWPTRGWITSVFGRRSDPFTGEQIMHAGVDLGAPEGTKVIAPAKGTVIFSGDRGGYGKMIIVDHGGGIVTQYGHLSRALVDNGDEVERGDHIASVGNTDRSTGPHLHYEVRVNGMPVNPHRYVLEW